MQQYRNTDGARNHILCAIFSTLSTDGPQCMRDAQDPGQQRRRFVRWAWVAPGRCGRPFGFSGSGLRRREYGPAFPVVVGIGPHPPRNLWDVYLRSRLPSACQPHLRQPVQDVPPKTSERHEPGTMEPRSAHYHGIRPGPEVLLARPGTTGLRRTIFGPCRGYAKVIAQCRSSLPNAHS
jgi:hypothetical protein